MLNIIQIPCKNYFPDSGQKLYVVIHGTAGGSSASAIAQHFISTEGTSNPVSTHYIVGLQGEIVQCVSEKDGAYGNGVVDKPGWQGNPNLYTVSIEHVKQSTDNSDNLQSPLQTLASFQLIEDICSRNSIPKDLTHIIPHNAITNTICPGPYPWQDLMNYLNPTNKYQDQAIDDCWVSIANTAKGTGIYNSWKEAYKKGKFYGPPLTNEYVSVDWNGNKITVQEFPRARCEWRNGVANWYE